MFWVTTTGASPARWSRVTARWAAFGSASENRTFEAGLPALDPHRAIADVALDRVALRVGGLPDAVRPAEVGDPGLGRDPGAGEDEDAPGVAKPRQRCRRGRGDVG